MIMLSSFIKYVFILRYIPFMLLIIKKMFKFALYFHLVSIHAHIILWINDVDVDRITDEIVAWWV
jgi:hypothetical protein